MNHLNGIGFANTNPFLITSAWICKPKQFHYHFCLDLQFQIHFNHFCLTVQARFVLFGLQILKQDLMFHFHLQSEITNG
jgi:hypothetical protein